MAQINVRQRHGGWEVRIELAPVNGKRKQKSRSGFRTKKEALEAGTKMMNEYNQAGEIFEPSEISVADYLEKWIELYCKVNLKPSTVASYQKKIRLYINPAFGNYRLRAISAATLQDFMNDIFNQGFSRNSLSCIKGILTGSFAYAVQPLGYIQFSPAAMIRLPLARAKAKTPTRKKERRPVTPEEWEQIIERFPEGHPAHVPLVLAYSCGLRLGEVFGLQWKDIDFKAGTLSVNRQITENAASKVWEFTYPKYDSFRTIAVDGKTLSLLKRQKEKQQKARKYYAELYTQIRNDNGHLSTTQGNPVEMVNRREDGSYIQPRTLQHVGRVIHGKNNKNAVPISEKWDFHSLRHTHATMLLEAGVPLPVIQERLGHTKIEMTEHYTDHVTPKMTAELNDTLSALYEKNSRVHQ